MIIKNRIKEHTPIIVCKTCGKRAMQNKVIELEAPELRNEKRKTWARLIKSSFNTYYTKAQKKRNRRIFYSALLLNCIIKKHKLQVKHLYNIDFHKSYEDTIKVLREKQEISKVKTKQKVQKINCASCNERIDVTEVCMNCGRCEVCCSCKVMSKLKKERSV